MLLKSHIDQKKLSKGKYSGGASPCVPTDLEAVAAPAALEGRIDASPRQGIFY